MWNKVSLSTNSACPTLYELSGQLSILLARLEKHIYAISIDHENVRHGFKLFQCISNLYKYIYMQGLFAEKKSVACCTCIVHGSVSFELGKLGQDFGIASFRISYAFFNVTCAQGVDAVRLYVYHFNIPLCV